MPKARSKKNGGKPEWEPKPPPSKTPRREKRSLLEEVQGVANDPLTVSVMRLLEGEGSPQPVRLTAMEQRGGATVRGSGGRVLQLDCVGPDTFELRRAGSAVLEVLTKREAVRRIQQESGVSARSATEVIEGMERDMLATQPTRDDPLGQGIGSPMLRMGMDIERLKSLAGRWGPQLANGGNGGRMINFGEVSELCQAVLPLIATLERGGAVDSSDRMRQLVEQVQGQNRALEERQRQIKSQADTIDSMGAKIRELEAAMEDEVTEESKPRRKRAALKMDDELNRGGPVTPPEDLHEDRREWLRELAQRNRPEMGKEVSVREVAALVLATEPLLDEIERMDEILGTALTVYPCHNQETRHVDMHRVGELCEDQLSLMAILLISEIGLAPQYLRRQLHARDCRLCLERGGDTMRDWLLTGATKAPPVTEMPEPLLGEVGTVMGVRFVDDDEYAREQDAEAEQRAEARRAALEDAPLEEDDTLETLPF